jgi:gamma-glutamyl-gamma-aminobutyrate hydrolase PuuD
MSRAARIGVTRWEDVLGEVVERYWTSVRDAGADVVDLEMPALERLDDLAPRLDGLVLTGGADVDPARYGAARHEKVKQTYPDRDAMELAYLDRALQRDIPVLAICRGHQLLNVGLGGSLLQHIESGEHRADYRTEGYPSRWHSVSVLPDSRLGRIFGSGAFETNSRHHQAVLADGLAPDLRPVAFSDDGGRQLIEGFEANSYSWVVGVQWHPERPEEHRAHFAPLMRRLFQVFVRECDAVRSSGR